MSVRDLTDGQECDLVLVCKRREDRVSSTGTPWVKLALADRTGLLTGVVRERCDEVPSACQGGTVVRVAGRVEQHPRYGQELVITAIRPADPSEADLGELLDGPPLSVEAMERDLRDLIATVQCDHLRGLLEAVFGPGTETWAAYREAPAAKRFHQAYRHGLLEHSLTVAQGVSSLSATFPGIDRDVAVTGALLHDIGKLDAYTTDPLAIEMTDRGKLQGEIPLGYYRIRRLIEDLPGFPAHTAQAVLHIVLSHHGKLEHGSPVVPCTREATLVHMVDNLGASLGSFDRIEKALPEGRQWSDFDRALSGAAWFAPRVAA
jgi:3'-5' exoribonuclease